jgi:protein-arginine kinase activator protein McsA
MIAFNGVAQTIKPPQCDRTLSTRMERLNYLAGNWKEIGCEQAPAAFEELNDREIVCAFCYRVFREKHSTIA